MVANLQLLYQVPSIFGHNSRKKLKSPWSRYFIIFFCKRSALLSLLLCILLIANTKISIFTLIATTPLKTLLVIAFQSYLMTILLFFNHILSFYSDWQFFLLIKIFRWWKTWILIFIRFCLTHLMRFLGNFLVFFVEMFLLGYKRIQPPPQPRMFLPPTLYRSRLP